MSEKVVFITQFNRSAKDFKKDSIKEYAPSEVKESISYATDINQIVDNYCKTGRLPLNGKQPIYDENFIKYDTLIEAQQAVKEACSYFQGLPAEIRMKYGNDLNKFVKALHSQDSFLVDKGVLKLSTSSENVVVPSVPSVDVPTVEVPTTDKVNTATTDVL